MKKILFSLMLSLILSSQTLAASNSDFSILRNSIELQTPVEQQTPGGSTQPDKSLWVVNPTRTNLSNPCIWDADDHITLQIYGSRIAPGSSATASICIIGDWTAHVIGVSRNSPYLDVTLSLSDIMSLKMNSDTACIVGPDYDKDAVNFGYLSPIADSNGGVGKFHTATVTVTNTKSKGFLKNANVTFIVEWTVSTAQDKYCPHGYPVQTNGHSGGSYPLRWWWDN